MEIIKGIEEKYRQLTSKQKDIADYMLANPESICYISLKDLSQRTGSSEVTILRFCQVLGFNSFLELKDLFREHTKKVIKGLDGTDLIASDISYSQKRDKLKMIQRIADSEANSSAEFYKNINTSDIIKTAQEILSANEVLIFGNQLSGFVGEFFYRRLVLLGIKATLVHPEDRDHVRACLSRLKPRDLIIAITFPRYYMPIKNIVRYSEEKGVQVIALTDSIESPAVTKDSLNFLCPSSTKLFYNSPALPLSIINLIASGMVIQMGPKYKQILEETKNIVNYIDESNS